MAISFSAFFFLLDDDIDDILLFLDLIVVIDIGRRRGLFFSPSFALDAEKIRCVVSRPAMLTPLLREALSPCLVYTV